MKAAELDALASYVEARSSLPLHSLGAELLALADADGTWSDMARRLSEMLWGLAGVVVLGGGMRLAPAWEALRRALPGRPLPLQDAADADACSQGRLVLGAGG